MEIMAKLGIFRSGSYKGTFKNAKEMPSEILMDDVYNSKKDLTTKEDIKKAAGAIAGKNDPGKSPGGNVGRKIFFWVAIASGAIFIIASFSSGVLVLFVNLLLWAVFLFFLRQFAFLGKYSVWLMIVAFIVLLIISLAITGSGDDSKNSTKKPSEESSAERAKKLEKYDGKTLTVSSADGKVSGEIGITHKEGNGSLQVFYHIFVQDALQENTVCFTCESNSKYNHDCRSWDKYNYAGGIGGSGEVEQRSTAISSSMMPVFCPEVPEIKNPNGYNSTGMNAGCFDLQVGKDITTNKFYFTTLATFESIEAVKAANKLSVYDAKDFMVRNSCVDGKVGSSLEKMETLEAVKGGSIQVYELKISE